MECSKAVATILTSYVRGDDKILDVGCGGGHYLRSLRRILQVPFKYTGVDRTPEFLEVAHRAWGGYSDVSFHQADIYSLPFQDNEFDIVICNDLLYHLPSVVKPVSELIRVARRLVMARTLVGARSFRVQEVYSSQFWPGAEDVDPSEEFTDEGEPRSFVYLNTYSKDYLTAIIRRSVPSAHIEYVPDTFFDPGAIERSVSEWKNPNPTRIIGGHQVIGQIIVPYHYVKIHKAAQ
jgi:ubiquinone/menaquinone biosynthesis C-methylase UbiE